MPISSELMQNLLPLLRPLMENESQRRGYLIRAFGTNNSVQYRLTLTAPTNDFIPNLVNELIAFGEVSPGKPAICALLEVIREDVGEDVKLCIEEQLQNIINNINKQQNAVSKNSYQISQTSVESIGQYLLCENTNLTLEKPEIEINPYTRLEELLKLKKWQAADQETKIILLKLFGKQEDDGLGIEEIRNLTCEVICSIDKLWKTYSNNRFGFSVQQKIWQELKSSKLNNKSILFKIKTFLGKVEEEDNNKIEKDNWYIFSQKVGWYQEGNWISYQNLTFELSAAEGSLPYCRGWWKGMRYQYEPKRFIELMSKVEKCYLLK